MPPSESILVVDEDEGAKGGGGMSGRPVGEVVGSFSGEG